MKISLVGITGVPLGKHKVKDPRMDLADKLVVDLKVDRVTAGMRQREAREWHDDVDVLVPARGEAWSAGSKMPG